MEYRYLTACRRARIEQVIEKSRFIATVSPVDNREEAERFFDEIRNEFRDATHNVPAMVIGDGMQLQWASDDGEPQGTAGAPMVQLMVNKELTNLAVMVSRYFGGIKLGTGGLVRAYTQSAELAIREAGIAKVIPYLKVKGVTDYSIYNKIINHRFPNELKERFEIESPEFSEKVSFSLSVMEGARGEIKKLLTELAGGNIEFYDGENILKKVAV